MMASTLRTGDVVVNAALTMFAQDRDRPNERANERLDERPMSDESQWLTYAALAEKLGVSAEAARQKAVRGRWRRQRGNDGRTLVLVEPAVLSRLKAGKRPSDERAVGRVNEHPDADRTVNALMEHVETLKAALARAEATVADRDADVRRERDRVEELTRELLRVTGEAMAAASARDDLRAELDAMRARPWWKRLTG